MIAQNDWVAKNDHLFEGAKEPFDSAVGPRMAWTNKCVFDAVIFQEMSKLTAPEDISIKERDEESGFNYHGARYYAPWLGRWTSADPAGMVDGTNLFGYCWNNPITRIDTSGLNYIDPRVEQVRDFLAKQGPIISTIPRIEPSVQSQPDRLVLDYVPGRGGVSAPQSEIHRLKREYRVQQQIDTGRNLYGGPVAAGLYLAAKTSTDNPDTLHAASQLGAAVDQAFLGLKFTQLRATQPSVVPPSILPSPGPKPTAPSAKVPNVEGRSSIRLLPGNDGAAQNGRQNSQAADTGGKLRAMKFGKNWQRVSLQETIERIAGQNPTITTTAIGKTIYAHPKSGLRVVYDNAGNYFRVENPAAKGMGQYLDQFGHPIPANIPLVAPQGTTQTGVPIDVRKALTHFMNAD